MAYALFGCNIKATVYVISRGRFSNINRKTYCKWVLGSKAPRFGSFVLTFDPRFDYFLRVIFFHSNPHLTPLTHHCTYHDLSHQYKSILPLEDWESLIPANKKPAWPFLVYNI